MMTPCGMYIKPMRTGGLATFPFAPSAQPMDSSKGSPNEAPRPRRQVRRLMIWDIGCGEGGEVTIYQYRPTGGFPSSDPQRLAALSRVSTETFQFSLQRLPVCLVLPAFLALLAFHRRHEQREIA